MSELLKVAAALRRMDDAELQTLVTVRMVNSASLQDFFDLADALTKPASISAAISGLPKNQIAALRELVAGHKAKPEIAEELAKLALVSPAPNFVPFDSTIDALSTFNRIELVSEAEPMAPATISQEQVDADAGVEIFETMQAITELIFDLEQRYVREVGKKNVGLPDLKRLATHLRKDIDYARDIYQLAHLANLIVLTDSRWQLSAQVENWLAWSGQQRFLHLGKTWRAILGESSAKELIDTIKDSTSVVSLNQKLTETYPFADGSVSSKITRLATLASLIGLSANGWMSSWAKPVLTGEFEKAAELANAKLPKPQNKIICQADLSLIAPGPLPTDIEMQLRRFADTEQIGMASSYRLSALSLSHGLETGMSIAEIRKLLTELSDKPLPQPVEYLLNEAEVRFARLVITSPESGGSVISSADQPLLTEILNETKLKPFSLLLDEDGTLHSRYEPELLYFGLRELGFVAVRKDTKGKVISPRTIATQTAPGESSSSVAADIARLREKEAKLGDNPDDEDLQRQIQLAIKNKAKARFTVASNNGEIEFILEPIGIANGRLRAKDRKADIERTLPLTSILKVVID